ncbi:metalloregulator ArsR/SmtB family transcription factor [Clostridium sp. BJN0001]|uniref:ArsR/SmtB family transcription factor n=1 Tax=Clostridium sp. BJN0001 TaxID=2930219 RepID=UPI001FD1C151|nr:metalloregulator ArsR/SmtB family transcription factor [Clostridium sp. BJN0001]
MKKDENGIESCNTTCIHEDVVNKVKSEIPDDEILYDLAELFKTFGDSTRVKIICALFQSEMCVCDLASVLSLSQSAVSHQLRILKQTRLVKFRRNGKVVYYSLDDDHIKEIFNQGFNHITE